MASDNKEVLLNTVVMQDDEDEELLVGAGPTVQSSNSAAPASVSGTETAALLPGVGGHGKHTAAKEDAEDEFDLDIAYVPRSKRGKEKDSTGFFSSASSRNATVSSSVVHQKTPTDSQNDGTVALDSYGNGLPDDADRPKDTEEWRRWQERQKARSQLPQFAMFQ